MPIEVILPANVITIGAAARVVVTYRDPSRQQTYNFEGPATAIAFAQGTIKQPATRSCELMLTVARWDKT